MVYKDKTGFRWKNKSVYLKYLKADKRYKSKHRYKRRHRYKGR